jgi:hypothetical protein
MWSAMERRGKTYSLLVELLKKRNHKEKVCMQWVIILKMYLNRVGSHGLDACGSEQGSFACFCKQVRKFSSHNKP